MARYCGKCGAKLDEKTGVCPNCDKRQIDSGNKRNWRISSGRNQESSGLGRKFLVAAAITVALLICGLFVLHSLKSQSTKLADTSSEKQEQTEASEVVKVFVEDDSSIDEETRFNRNVQTEEYTATGAETSGLSLPDDTDSPKDGFEVSVRDRIERVIYNESTGEMVAQCYHVPEIVLVSSSGNEVDTETYRIVNDQIEQDMRARIWELDPSYEDDGIPGTICLTYQWTRTGDALSLVIRSIDKGVYSGYYVYNVSVETGQILSATEFLEQCGISQEDFYSKVQTSLEKYCSNLKFPDVPDLSDYEREVQSEDQARARKSTLESENIHKVVPVMRSDGQLEYVARVTWPVNAGFYYDLINFNGESDGDNIVCLIDYNQ